MRLGLRWFVKRKIGPATTLEALLRQEAFLERVRHGRFASTATDPPKCPRRRLAAASAAARTGMTRTDALAICVSLVLLLIMLLAE